MVKFKGFEKTIKAVQKAVSGKDKDKEPKAITALKKKVLQEQLKQLKKKKVEEIVERKKSILSKNEEQQPRKQMTFLGRI